MKKIEWIPTLLGVPEYGTECVIKIAGLFGTATYGHNGKWHNENYIDGFEQSDITAWIAIVDLQYLPTFTL